MPKIDFSFSGWISGANVEKVTVVATLEEKDVSSESAESVAHKLEQGEYSLALGDYLYEDSRKTEISIFDYCDGEV